MRASSTALSRSASSKIMNGDLPPSSSETGFKLLLAAARITSRPTSVEPVKLTYTCTIEKQTNCISLTLFIFKSWYFQMLDI